MLTSYTEAYKNLIFAKHGEEPQIPVGRVLDFVINPESGIFEAIWVQSPHGLALLSPKDIYSWNAGELFIANGDELVDPEEFPRIKKTLEKEVAILGSKVYIEKTGEYLGKVKNFAFDTISPRILTLIIKSGFLGFGKEQIINRKKVSKIKKGIILITENKAKIQKKQPKNQMKNIKHLPEMDFKTKSKTSK